MSWRKSSFSFANGNCIEVSDGVLIRDTMNPQGFVLNISADVWMTFINSIKQ